MKYILNSPILTEYGLFQFTKIDDLKTAKEFVEGEFVSAIGHQGTAELLTNLLNREIKANRLQIKMNKGDEALVVRLKIRLEEGRILSYEEVRKLYEEGNIELGIIKRIE